MPHGCRVSLRLFSCALLVVVCSHVATGQVLTNGPAPPPPSLSGAFTNTPSDDLAQQVRALSAEVERLQQVVNEQSASQKLSPVDYVLPAQVPPAPSSEDDAFPTPQLPPPYYLEQDMLQGKFDEGWQFRSANGHFVLKPDTEVNLDTVWLTADQSVQYGNPGAIGPVTDGINIRRGRLGAKGTIYENFEYMIQYDFNLATTVRNASGTGTSVINSPNPTEIWGMFRDLPYLHNVRIGNQKPLWSFENFTSSRFQNFMERSLGWDAFCEDQDNGFIPSIVMLNHNEDASFVYQAGIGKNNRSGFFFNPGAGEYLVEGRTVITPWYEDEGRYLLHLGVGGMYADTDNNIARFRARTLLRNGSNQTHPIMTEARMYANSEARLVPELVMQFDRLSIQGEYYMSWATDARTFAGGANGPNLGTWFGSSWYLQANYFLTGEYMPYDRKQGRWGRIIPKHNFSPKQGGWGAWVIGARYSTINLNDLGGVNGGGANPSGFSASSAKVDDVSLAVNWIINPNTRMIFDGILENRHTANTPTSNGNVSGFGMRMQYDY